jgi:hypothetical protein
MADRDQLGAVLDKVWEWFGTKEGGAADMSRLAKICRDANFCLFCREHILSCHCKRCWSCALDGERCICAARKKKGQKAAKPDEKKKKNGSASAAATPPTATPSASTASTAAVTQDLVVGEGDPDPDVDDYDEIKASDHKRYDQNPAAVNPKNHGSVLILEAERFVSRFQRLVKECPTDDPRTPLNKWVESRIDHAQDDLRKAAMSLGETICEESLAIISRRRKELEQERKEFADWRAQKAKTKPTPKTGEKRTASDAQVDAKKSESESSSDEEPVVDTLDEGTVFFPYDRDLVHNTHLAWQEQLKMNPGAADRDQGPLYCCDGYGDQHEEDCLFDSSKHSEHSDDWFEQNGWFDSPSSPKKKKKRKPGTTTET